MTGVAAAFSLLFGMAALSLVHCGKSRFTRSQEAIYDYRTALGAAQNQYWAETARPQREKCCDEPMSGWSATATPAPIVPRKRDIPSFVAPPDSFLLDGREPCDSRRFRVRRESE